VVSWEPATTYIEVRNETITISHDSSIAESYVRDPDDNVFVLGSRVPEGRIDREALAVWNPTLYFAHVLRETLEAAGIPVRGAAVDVDDRARRPDYADDRIRRLALHRSPPISDIAALVNKPSHNLAAESLLKTLGRLPETKGAASLPGSWERGAQIVARTLARAGIDTNDVRLLDGSGLSRLNLITPHAFAQLLGYMWNHPDEAVRDAFVASLAAGGGEGTLSSRFSSGATAGRVRARTGTMTSVSALAGYLMRGSRPPIAFVVVCNNYTVPTRRVRAAQDDIVNLLARLSL
jgi:D-alanyl-D-alanine carboxypeptidase/D-alanyl-D-alanine-endopeptidase (penicillin-binding protein 4)